MSEANEKQVAGSHYKSNYQHWDWSEDVRLPALLYASTKYLTRWRKKGGVQDLEKAKHYLDKYIEVMRARIDKQAEATKRFWKENNTEFQERNIMIGIMSHIHGDTAHLTSASEDIQRMINSENAKNRELNTHLC